MIMSLRRLGLSGADSTKMADTTGTVAFNAYSIEAREQEETSACGGCSRPTGSAEASTPIFSVVAQDANETSAVGSINYQAKWSR